MALSCRSKERIWQQHGREGVAAIKSILQHLRVYPQAANKIAGLTPQKPPSQSDRNTAKKAEGYPTVKWDDLTLIRGVELWLEDPTMLEGYTWDMRKGGPTTTEFQCLVSSGEIRPGEYNVTYCQQAKAHWFWAMYRDEAENHLVVKWVRGRCPPGGKR